MARAAADLGCEVAVVTRLCEHQKIIEDAGIRVIPFSFERRNLNPLKELLTVFRLAAVFRREKPDIVHNVAVKLVLDGTLAALFSPVGHVVNSFIGMGVIFTGQNDRELLRSILPVIFRSLMRSKNVYTIVQNKDDLSLLETLKISIKERTVLIRGSGVDLVLFSQTPEPDTPVRVVMVSRLLWDKGIGELVEAARLLKQRGCSARVRIVGSPDPGNPKTVDEKTLSCWQAEGIIEFSGQNNEIAKVWASSHIAVLPSYREGLPMSLLEAASCGRPLIATDVPGCRELVKDGVNGILVPAYDASALADAIETLVNDRTLRKNMGQQARTMVEADYSSVVVMEKIKELYAQLLDVDFKRLSK